MKSASEYFSIEALSNELGGKAGPIQELVNTEIKKIGKFPQMVFGRRKNQSSERVMADRQEQNFQRFVRRKW